MLIQLMRAVMTETPIHSKDDASSEHAFMDLLQLAEENTGEPVEELMSEELLDEADVPLLMLPREAQTVIRELLERLQEEQGVFTIDAISGELILEQPGDGEQRKQPVDTENQTLLHQIEQLISGEVDSLDLIKLERVAAEVLYSAIKNSAALELFAEEVTKWIDMQDATGELKEVNQLLTVKEAEALLVLIQSELKQHEPVRAPEQAFIFRRPGEQTAARPVFEEPLPVMKQKAPVKPVKSEAFLHHKPLPDIRVQTFVPLSMQAAVTESTGRQETMIKQFETLVKRLQVQQMQNGAQQLTIRLHPQSLGRLEVTLQQVNGVMQARIMTFTSQAREVMEQTVHQLKQAFQQQNLQLDRIDIQQSVQQWKEHQESKRQQQEPNLEAAQEDEEEQDTDLDFSELMASLLEEVND
ncbi:flagellar hook-length control protein FliK [Alkalicoccus luteus]|uniref:flagellar hook-length control protein FliK n=1 Tax=Alkalicoccus luteus TaxID=1237094 RepID=UPI0040336118